MRKIYQFAGLLVCVTLIGVSLSFKTSPDKGQDQDPPAKKINWITFEEAVKLNQKNGRKIVIDFYTDWCGWCKRMDATTFQDPAVADYVNAHFYAVKFNAEQKDSLVFRDHTFKYIPNGKRGIHEFAYEVLNRRPSYPTIVFFDEKNNPITIAPGYRDAFSMRSMLNWIKDNQYLKRSWEDFHQEFAAKHAPSPTPAAGN